MRKAAVYRAVRAIQHSQCFLQSAFMPCAGNKTLIGFNKSYR